MRIFDAQSEIAATNAEAAKGESGDAFNDTFGDYDPPEITTQAIIDDFETEAAVQEDNMNIVLEEFNSPDDSKDDDFSEPIAYDQELPDSPEDIINVTPERIYDLFLYDSDVFKFLRLNLDSFADYAILFDTIFRIIHTIFIINKYWTLSGVGTPPGDARINKVAGGIFGLRETFDQKVARWGYPSICSCWSNCLIHVTDLPRLLDLL